MESNVKVIMSPLRGRDGQYHTQEWITTSTSLGEIFPEWDLGKVTITIGGKQVENPENCFVKNGSEIIVTGRIHMPPILIVIAITIVVSIALSLLTTLLFPVKPPKIKPPEADEGASYSWQGIQTTQGPGNVVPVIYGRRRTGGQLLSSFVEDRTNTAEFSVQDPVLHMLISVGEGEVQEIETGTIELNDQPIANYNELSVVTRQGTAGQTPIPFFNQVKNTFDAGNVDFSVTPTTYTTSVPVQGFILHVDFSLGLFSVNPTDGSRIPNTVVWRYRRRIFGSGSGGWTAFTNVTTTADQRKAVHRPIKVEDIPLEKYDIELEFVSAEFDDESSGFQTFLTKVSEIIDETLAYPNTALYGLKIVATENLQGSLPNVTVIVKGIKVRVGSFAASPTYSDNPAWCLMDFLTNTRYGMGLADSEIDLASFISFADYCDELVDVDEDNDSIVDYQEKRALLAYILDTDTDAPQVIDEILQGTRSSLIKTAGLWRVRVAQDSAPVQLITWAATVRDSVSLTYMKDTEDTNVLEARFPNDEDDFEQDVLTYPREEDWPQFINKSSLEFRSFTRASQVERETAFNLVSRRFQKQVLEFKMNIAGMVFEIMDVIRFSHPLAGYGFAGRVVEQYGTTTNDVRTIILDSEVTFTFGIEYHIFVQNEDGIQNERILENPVPAPGTLSTRILRLEGTEPDLDFIPSAGLTQWAFGAVAPEQAIKEFRITRVERSGDFVVSVSAVEHNATIFDPFTATLLASPSHLIRPDGPPPPLIQLISFQESLVQVDGTLRESIGLEWDVMPIEEANALGAQKYSPYGAAYIYRRYVAGSAIAGQLTAGTFEAGTVGGQSITDLSGYNLVGSVAGQQAFQYRELAAPLGTTLEYQVVPVSSRGVPNNEGSLRTVIVVGEPDPNILVPVGPFIAVNMVWQPGPRNWRVTVTPPTNVDKSKIGILYFYRNTNGNFKPHPELQFGEVFDSIPESGGSTFYTPQFEINVVFLYTPTTDAIGTIHYFWFWYGMIDGRTSPPFPDITIQPGSLVQTVPSF